MSSSLSKEQKKAFKKERISRRIWELDFIRGLSVSLLVLDHAMISICTVFYSAWIESPHPFFKKAAHFAYQFFADRLYFSEYEWIFGVRGAVRPWVIAAFFMLCGVSCAFSRSNLKRGLKLAAVAMAYSGLSYLINVMFPDLEGFLVLFGVLHMLACCILIWCLICAVFKDGKGAVGVALTLACFVYFFLDKYLASLPTPTTDSFWSIFHLNLTAYGRREFSPGDYFPIIPNLAFFLWGVVLGRTVYKNKRSLLPFMQGKWNRPVLFLGRHALLIYLTHVIVISGLLAVITFLWASPGNWY